VDNAASASLYFADNFNSPLSSIISSTFIRI
jgi:hypothetical protein